VSEVAPHSYSPDYQAMGDCRVCGNIRSDCDRFQAALSAAKKAGQPMTEKATTKERPR
jgi:hypothetical protein